jgi:hypothetical protein
VRLVVSPHDVLVDRASVDDSAHVVLRGDALVAYSVQVVGDHMPVCVEGVRCGNAEPLRVRIPAGAEVRVRPSPPDVLARLWPTRSSLGLVRASDGHVRQLLAAKADGTLSASDLAPGDWSLCFVDGPVSHTFARVTLTGTELVDLEAAMPWLRLAKMRVRVLGERNTVYLQRERPGEGPPSDREWIALPLLSSEVTVPSGRYRVRRMYVPQAVSTAVLDAPPDSSVDVEVAVPLANVEITLRDRAGLPVPDARLGLVRAGVMTREDLLPDSDGNGVVQSGCGVGTFEVVLLPKLAWEATTGGRPLTPLPLVTSLEARTLLGTITVCEGQRTVAAFVLP